MKISITNIKVLATLLASLTAAIAIAKIPALVQQEENVPVPPAAAELPAASKEDMAILRELYAVSHQLDHDSVYTMAGRITVKDLKDSTRNMENNYFYTRAGNKAYYRLGESESVTLPEFYASISRETKQIIVTPAKEVIPPAVMSTDMQVSSMSKEGYKITRTSANGMVTISLANPSHATMREYTLTYDSTGWMTKTAMRMADEIYPADPGKDKLISIVVTRFSPGKAEETLLKPDHYVSQQGNDLMPSSSFKDYELLKAH